MVVRRPGRPAPTTATPSNVAFSPCRNTALSIDACTAQAKESVNKHQIIAAARSQRSRIRPKVGSRARADCCKALPRSVQLPLLYESVPFSRTAGTACSSSSAASPPPASRSGTPSRPLGAGSPALRSQSAQSHYRIGVGSAATVPVICAVDKAECLFRLFDADEDARLNFGELCAFLSAAAEKDWEDRQRYDEWCRHLGADPHVGIDLADFCRLLSLERSFLDDAFRTLGLEGLAHRPAHSPSVRRGELLRRALCGGFTAASAVLARHWRVEFVRVVTCELLGCFGASIGELRSPPPSVPVDECGGPTGVLDILLQVANGFVEAAASAALQWHGCFQDYLRRGSFDRHVEEWATFNATWGAKIAAFLARCRAAESHGRAVTEDGSSNARGDLVWRYMQAVTKLALAIEAASTDGLATAPEPLRELQAVAWRFQNYGLSTPTSAASASQRQAPPRTPTSVGSAPTKPAPRRPSHPAVAAAAAAATAAAAAAAVDDAIHFSTPPRPHDALMPQVGFVDGASDEASMHSASPAAAAIASAVPARSAPPHRSDQSSLEDERETEVQRRYAFPSPRENLPKEDPLDTYDHTTASTNQAGRQAASPFNAINGDLATGPDDGSLADPGDLALAAADFGDYSREGNHDHYELARRELGLGFDSAEAPPGPDELAGSELAFGQARDSDVISESNDERKSVERSESAQMGADGRPISRMSCPTSTGTYEMDTFDALSEADEADRRPADPRPTDESRMDGAVAKPASLEERTRPLPEMSNPDVQMEILLANEYTEIAPRLFLAGDNRPKKIFYLNGTTEDIAPNFDFVVRCSEKPSKCVQASAAPVFVFPPTEDAEGRVHVGIHCFDRRAKNDLLKLKDCCIQIKAKLEQQSNVLVHCEQGVDRSATIVASFCMAYFDISTTDARESLNKLRPACTQQAPEYEDFLRTNESRIRRFFDLSQDVLEDEQDVKHETPTHEDESGQPHSRGSEELQAEQPQSRGSEELQEALQALAEQPLSEEDLRRQPLAIPEQREGTTTPSSIYELDIAAELEAVAMHGLMTAPAQASVGSSLYELDMSREMKGATIGEDMKPVPTRPNRPANAPKRPSCGSTKHFWEGVESISSAAETSLHRENFPSSAESSREFPELRGESSDDVNQAAGSARESLGDSKSKHAVRDNSFSATAEEANHAGGASDMEEDDSACATS